MSTKRINRMAWGTLGAVLFAGACSNGSDGGFDPDPDRIVSVGVYIDGFENCDGPPNQQPDLCEAFGGAGILLLGQTGDTVMTSLTSTQPANEGTGLFQDVDVGTYRVSVAASTLGDSLQIEAMELRQQSGNGWLPGVEVDDFAVSFSDDVVYINLRLVRLAAP